MARLIASLTVLSSLLVAAPVFGQIAINQSKATSGLAGCDAPGFPVTICKSGSYKLTGNLTVPNADTTAIEIAASHVTLDLNGFAILGPTDCTGGLTPCANSGNGRGVVTSGVQFDITIRNGTVHGMGGVGIVLEGDSHMVEHMHVRNNGGGGISIVSSLDAGSSIVQHSTVQRNAIFGVFMFRGVVRHSTVDVNSTGITLFSGGSAFHNVVSRNLSVGLNLSTNSGYLGNTLLDNSPNVSAGRNLGQNLCDTAVCP